MLAEYVKTIEMDEQSLLADPSDSHALIAIHNQRQLQSGKRAKWNVPNNCSILLVNFLSQRTFQGVSLNPDDRDLTIHTGRTGIASSYADEH